MTLFPMRSILFVPADRPELAVKAAGSAADAICLDLEDGVAPDRKPAARAVLADTAAPLLEAGKPLWLRVNSELEETVADIAAAPAGTAAIILAKSRDLTHAALVGEMIDRRAGAQGPALVALIEDPAAIAAFAAAGPRRAHSRLAALALGVEDLAAELAAATGSGLIRRQFHDLVLAAHGLGLPCLGYPGSIAEFRDLDGFAAPLAGAAADGAVGGFCIHPAQIAPLNRCFGVRDEDRDWAGRVVAAFEAGGGVVTVDGRMVDRPVYERARKLLARAAGNA
ncbi:aldolase/citrate lyase family protein [Actibacterium sp. MT2.3-13A]|uniref:HpcH/HpaI aldolase/citrate lyase family protein n=1 Tax=Actibacterium sp. MT2.3-13A TaxID=2828332 RepID=UPI001BA94D90|nr:aldolase/citrate lyase family protein [Actibacterium sp. MT2.3-13A]